MENKIRKITRQVLKEFISKRELEAIENYADAIFSDIDVDVEFSKHFLDRVNDPRNKKEIKPEELEDVFTKTRSKHGDKIAKMKDYEEAVINDTHSDINIPFASSTNKKGKKEVVNKTIMRKKDFLTTNPKLKV